jgi:hypothetical protein
MSAALPYRLPPEEPEEREGFGFSILEKLDEFRALRSPSPSACWSRSSS